MSGCSEQFEQFCKPQFDAIHVKLDKLDEAVRGNGKPGIQLRLDIVGSTVTLAVGAVWKLILGA